MANRTLNITKEAIAAYIIENGATREQAATHFNCSKETIRRYLNTLSDELKEQLNEIAKRNKSEKPATRADEQPVTIVVTATDSVQANGYRIGGNAHPIIDLTTGDIYASSTDAAEKLEVTPSAMSWNITGRTQTCKGHKFIKVVDAGNNISAVSKAIKNANEKADKAQVDADIQIEAVRAETAEQIRVAYDIAETLTEARQTAENAAREAENKYNALAEKLAAVATLDKEIAELEQRLAEAKANREIAYNNLFK